MKILYLLGNGFDVNLKLRTKYTDFYETYKDSESKSDSILELKERIKTEETWANLESALGKHTERIKTVSEFIEVFEDIGDNLAEYLKEQERKVDNMIIDKDKFYEHLSFPERLLTRAQKNQITALRAKWNNHQWNTYAITFNYTQTFERLILEEDKPIQIGNHHRAKIIYHGIQHVHGYIDDAMVMGVNDISQIANETFRNELEILNAFVKTNCNKAMQHTIDDQCKQHIQSANLICIFGSSIGITDKLWWETIGKRLKEDCYLIIFGYTEKNISRRREYKREAIRQDLKNSFLDKTNLTEEEKEKVLSKIFVGINRDMFKIIKNEN